MSDSLRESQESPDEGDIHEMHDPIAREFERPEDGYQPIPLTLIFLFFALVGWGGWYLGAYSGDWRVDVFYPGDRATAAAEAQEESSGGTSPEELATLGKRVYAQCAACHQQNGKGVAGNFPPLDGTEWVTGPPETLIRILLHGLEGPIQVAGNEYNAQMPAWGGQLSDRQIAAVLTYIRSAWSNDAGPVKPTQVESLRKATADRSASWTASELKSLESSE
jgi:mono/diheme cytochrome c family protein